MTFTMCRDLHKQREDGPSKKSSISPSLHSLVFAFICHFFISILKLERHWPELHQPRRSQEVIWTRLLESHGQVCGWINPKTTYKTIRELQTADILGFLRLSYPRLTWTQRLCYSNWVLFFTCVAEFNQTSEWVWVCVCVTRTAPFALQTWLIVCFVEERCAVTFLYVRMFDFHLVSDKKNKKKLNK